MEATRVNVTIEVGATTGKQTEHELWYQLLDILDQGVFVCSDTLGDKYDEVTTRLLALRAGK